MFAFVVIFYVSLGLVLYGYVVFPLMLLVRGALWPSAYRRGDVTPRVSLIIIAHNEAPSIAAKLANLLELDYPRELIEIIVASDGSDDGTNEIVRPYADRGVRLLDLPRRGKIPTLNAAVEHAGGEILVFSDANSMFSPESLRRLVAPFADERVGAVAGNQRYLRGGANAASIGERLYWNIDRVLKRMQSRSGNAIAATGAIHAIRRELFRPVPSAVCDDFVISARAIEQGYRLAFEPEAVAYECTATSDEAEFARRTRIVVRGLRALWVLRRLFNPLRYGFYSVQLASHKLLRWSGGWVLLALLVSSIVLCRAGWVYSALCIAQLACYSGALIAMALRNTRWRWLTRPLALPYYFSLVNLATVRAWLRILSGARIDSWDPHRSVPARGST